MNLRQIDAFLEAHPDLDLVLVESGGDNLAATFNPELADYSLYVISVAEGDDIPRKRGPGVVDCDLLVVNKTDLAPHVGADLDVLEQDAREVRDGPFEFTDCKAGDGVDAVLDHVRAGCCSPDGGRRAAPGVRTVRRRSGPAGPVGSPGKDGVLDLRFAATADGTALVRDYATAPFHVSGRWATTRTRARRRCSSSPRPAASPRATAARSPSPPKTTPSPSSPPGARRRSSR